MMGSRQIALHFVWTIVIAGAVFRIGDPAFQMVLLFNAGFAAAVAAIRREVWRLRRLTLWDEAAALLGICALVRLIR